MLYVLGIPVGELMHSHLVYWKSLENIEYKSKGNKQSNPGVSLQSSIQCSYFLSWFPNTIYILWYLNLFWEFLLEFSFCSFLFLDFDISRPALSASLGFYSLSLLNRMSSRLLFVFLNVAQFITTGV